MQKSQQSKKSVLFFPFTEAKVFFFFFLKYFPPFQAAEYLCFSNMQPFFSPDFMKAVPACLRSFVKEGGRSPAL